MGRNPSILIDKDTVTLVMNKRELHAFIPEDTADERVCLVIDKRQFEQWLEDTCVFIGEDEE